MLASLSSDSDSFPRKRLRKGTHSCLECRRRKVRCVPEPNSQRCKECTSREAPCTQQELSGEKQKLSGKQDRTDQRLRDIEVVLGQILERLPAKERALSPGEPELGTAGTVRSLLSELRSSTVKATGSSARRPTGLAACTPEHSDATSTLDHAVEDAPLLSLFNNSILHQVEDRIDGHRAESCGPVDQTNGRPLNGKTNRTLRDLKTLVPNVKDLTLILRCSQDSWKLWYKFFSEDLGARLGSAEDTQVEIIRDFIYKSVNSDNVAVVAKVILCLTLHIQQLPPDFASAQTNLLAPTEALQSYYMSSVETLLGPDEGFAGTLDGLECMMIQAEFYINVGKPRKVWLIFRRAVSFAHLLGLHHQVDVPGDKEASRRRTLWLQIWQSDRELSLVLGLPYAVSDSFLTIETATNDHFGRHKESRFLSDLGIVTGRIIDRNQNHRQMTYSATLQLDQELEECKRLMPQSWWETSSGIDMSLEAIYTMFVIKLKYHNIRKLLHLPFMLKAYTDHRYDRSRLATLESARDMIKVYQILRDEKRSVLKMCDMVDFQVFTAAIILVIDLLGHSRASTHHDSQQQERDWEKVYGITQDLKRVSLAMTCNVAEQAARLLEDFYNAHHGYSASGEKTYEATIPYFGKLRIVRDQSFAPWTKQALSPEQQNLESNADPLISFDGYFQPLPGAFQPYQDSEADWTSNLAVDDDWSWFPNSTETQ